MVPAAVMLPASPAPVAPAPALPSAVAPAAASVAAAARQRTRRREDSCLFNKSARGPESRYFG